MPIERVKPDQDGKYYEDFWVFHGELALRRRFTGKAVEKLQSQGGFVARYETDGMGQPVDENLRMAINPQVKKHERQEAFTKYQEALEKSQKPAAPDPSPTPTRTSGKG